jgi:hypothetical protein
MPLFLFIVFFVHGTGRSTVDVLHYYRYCMDVVGWKHLESTVEESGFEHLLCTSEALMAQYLNVGHRKLDTIIIQTVHSVQHDSAITGSLPDREVLHGQPNILPINPTRQ